MVENLTAFNDVQTSLGTYKYKFICLLKKPLHTHSLLSSVPAFCGTLCYSIDTMTLHTFGSDCAQPFSLLPSLLGAKSSKSAWLG